MIKYHAKYFNKSFYFPRSYRLHRFSKNMSSFPPKDNWKNQICNLDPARNVTQRNKSHLIGYDKPMIKKQELYIICENDTCKFYTKISGFCCCCCC